MPITGQGWEILVTRHSVQARPSDGKRRTVGTYQVFHDGVAVDGLSGTTAESRGPGANAPAGNGRRIEAGTYPLATQDGGKYCTIGFTANVNPAALRRPRIELRQTGQRQEVPRLGFSHEEWPTHSSRFRGDRR